MSMVAFQVGGAVGCVLSAAWNFKQALGFQKERKRLKVVCKIVLRDNGERVLGIVGTLPEPGTILYRIDTPTKNHTVTA